MSEGAAVVFLQEAGFGALQGVPRHPHLVGLVAHLKGVGLAHTIKSDLK